MTKYHSERRPLRFESLEQKKMLAGDVLVSVVEGNLIIEGDAQDNQIAIQSGPEPGTYVVAGLDGTMVHWAGDSPGDTPNISTANASTTDAPQTEIVVEGVRRGAKIAMGEGNDLVVIHDAAFRGNVVIGTGEGDDRVVIGAPLDHLPGPGPEVPSSNVSAEADGELDGDHPNDGASVRIGRSLLIRTGEGEDLVRVGSAAIRGSLRIGTGADDDTVLLGGPALEGPSDPVEPGPEVKLAASNDGQPDQEPADGEPYRPSLAVGQKLQVRLGEGDDDLAIGHARSGSMAVNGGEGEDAIRLAHTYAGRSLEIFGGRGDFTDRVSLDNVRAAHALIGTGAGNDYVRIVDSAFRQLGVALGQGDDTLAVGGTSAHLAMFLGGQGEDSYENLGENMFHHKMIHGFELPPLEDGEEDGAELT